MEKVRLMNMCKIINQKNGMILVQERVKSWEGIAFPGGKIEVGESIVDSVKREVFEETGLKVKNLKICGVKDWYDFKEETRYMIFLFETNSYQGNLLSETSEGKVYWISQNELKNKKVASDFDKLLEVFECENINEMIYVDNKNSDEDLRWDLKLY